jgi:hypothetical protein
LKAEAQWAKGERVVTARTEVLPLISVPPAKKGTHGARALRKTGMTWAPHSVSVRGHG